jgi:DNA-binding transcriptional ArsR family regulator
VIFPSLPPAQEAELFERTANYFSILSDPTRLHILHKLCLTKSDLSVGEIVSMTGLSQPNVSRHLTRLYGLRIVSRRRHKNQVYYKLTDPAIEELCGLVCKHVV